MGMQIFLFPPTGSPQKIVGRGVYVEALSFDGTWPLLGMCLGFAALVPCEVFVPYLRKLGKNKLHLGESWKAADAFFFSLKK